jgi:hypothetical protein
MKTGLKAAMSAVVLMAALPAPAFTQAPTPKDATVISPIFGQLVRFQMPLSFVVMYENTKGTQYTREAVPKGETVERWTQMITVTGYKGLAANANVTPEKFAGGIAGGFKRLCPDSFAAKGLGATKFSGADAYVAIAGCGAVGNRSEAVLVAVVKGATDYYTVQWAERGAAGPAPAVEDARWTDRLRALQPIALCTIVAGEASPFPSCIGKKP